MVRLACILALCAFIGACNVPKLTTQNTPDIGWTARQVEGALGPSADRTTWASGFEVWRYGIYYNSGSISPLCGRYKHCMSVYLQNGVVTDVKLPY